MAVAGKRYGGTVCVENRKRKCSGARVTESVEKCAGVEVMQEERRRSRGKPAEAEKGRKCRCNAEGENRLETGRERRRRRNVPV